MNTAEILWGLVGFFLTVMVLSYLIGDNFFFRFAAYLFVGLTAGYLAVLMINQILWPYLIVPLVSGTMIQRLWLLAPLGLILLLLLSQIRRFSILGRLPLAFLAGTAAAVTIGGVLFGTLIPQSLAVINAFDLEYLLAVPEQIWLRVIDAIVMLVGAVATLSYFYFGAKRRQPGEIDSQQKRPIIFESLSKIGQVFMGITLGAVFAGVYSTALLALMERIVFMGDFFIRLFGGG